MCSFDGLVDGLNVVGRGKVCNEISFRLPTIGKRTQHYLIIATNQRVVAAKRQQRELVALW